jgi:hypothetical protein
VKVVEMFMQLDLVNFESSKQKHKKGALETLYYLEDFISDEQEKVNLDLNYVSGLTHSKELLSSIYNQSASWHNLAGRRVQSWGGTVTAGTN